MFVGSYNKLIFFYIIYCELYTKNITFSCNLPRRTTFRPSASRLHVSRRSHCWPLVCIVVGSLVCSWVAVIALPVVWFFSRPSPSQLSPLWSRGTVVLSRRSCWMFVNYNKLIFFIIYFLYVSCTQKILPSLGMYQGRRHFVQALLDCMFLGDRIVGLLSVLL